METTTIIITENSIKESLREIIAKIIEIKPDEISDDSLSMYDIGVDSADMIQLLYDIEDEFKVEISDDEVGGDVTLQAMTDMLFVKVNSEAAIDV
ncbi:MAG: hypothetical protein GY941_26600 [Planctomycetes bacterium]|nr:hypothetical protein [Planctomycetota bacterium]